MTTTLDPTFWAWHRWWQQPAPTIEYLQARITLHSGSYTQMGLCTSDPERHHQRSKAVDILADNRRAKCVTLARACDGFYPSYHHSQSVARCMQDLPFVLVQILKVLLWCFCQSAFDAQQEAEAMTKAAICEPLSFQPCFFFLFFSEKRSLMADLCCKKN